MTTKSISDLIYECPVCLDKILPPVYQCINGHILCETCQKKVKHCPVCRKRFPVKERIRCLEVERIIKMQEHFCPHSHKGCSSTLKWNEVREHELDCMFASLNFCELMGIRNCSAMVSKQELLNHFVIYHDNDVRYVVPDGYLETPYNLIMPLPTANSRTTEYIAIAVHEKYCRFCPVIFILAIRYGRGTVSWVPYILGSKKTAAFYGCQIQMGAAIYSTGGTSWCGPVFSIDNKWTDESEMCLTVTQADVRKISIVSNASGKAYYQMKIKFKRNPNAGLSQSGHILPAEAAAESTVQS